MIEGLAEVQDDGVGLVNGLQLARAYSTTGILCEGGRMILKTKTDPI